MDRIEWIDTHDIDVTRMIGLCRYGEFEVRQTDGQKAHARFSTRGENGFQEWGRVATTWCDAVMWCEEVFRKLAAGDRDFLKPFRLQQNEGGEA